MSLAIGKCNKIRHIVTLRQMLRRWRKNAASHHITADVPSGHVAICVGTSRRRFVVRATYLNHPIFQKLLVQAEEVYGFTNQGPLTIPCDESVFEEILRFVSRSGSEDTASRFVNIEDFQKCCHVDYRTGGQSRPLLMGLAE